jgi:hypothetical protein
VHVVWLNRVAPDLFKRSLIAGRNDMPYPDASSEHGAGLRGLLTYLQGVARDDNHVLLLDSDAFPIHPNWLEKLLAWMQADERVPPRTYATAVRTENLDTFPHPCIFFVRGDYFRGLSSPADHFGFCKSPERNLLGVAFEDVTCRLIRDASGRQLWLPMTRTNLANPHPVFAAVYGGLFYHHGAGSRSPELRCVHLRQFDHHIPRSAHAEIEQALYRDLSTDPMQFLGRLTQSIAA